MQNMNIRGLITICLVHFLWGFCLCDENATKAVKPAAINYRLPRSVFPEYYALNILTHINDEEGFKYYGDVRIKVRRIDREFSSSFSSILHRLKAIAAKATPPFV